MSEILSQKEINELMVDISNKSPEELYKLELKLMEEYSSVKYINEKFMIYDFRRPDKVSRNQVITLQMIHEQFATDASVKLSKMLNKKVSIHVASVDQLTYEEFIRSIPDPTVMSVIKMKPLTGSCLLEIDPSIAFPILDYNSGSKAKLKRKNRKLTDKEKSEIKDIFKKFAIILKAAWSDIIDLKPQIKKVETDPKLMLIVPPNDMIILISFEVSTEDYEGMMSLCIPYITIDPIINNFKQCQCNIVETKAFDDIIQRKSSKHKPDIKNLTLCAVLATTKFPVCEMDSIRNGNIIEFCESGYGVLDIYIEDYNLLIARGDAGVSLGYSSVKITEKLFKSSQLKPNPVPEKIKFNEDELPCRLIYGKTLVSLSDIKKLKNDSIIVLDHETGTPFDVELGNEFYSADAVLIGDKFGARLVMRNCDNYLTYKKAKSSVFMNREKNTIHVSDKSMLENIEKYIIEQGYKKDAF
jgi:flagellar motor switch protein FliM